jgi:hypothetical protein
MISVGPLKFGNAILCDDIRREEGNNKYILIGIYSGDIILSNMPAEFQLAFYIEIFAPAGHYDLQIRLSGPQKGAEAILPTSFDHAGGDQVGTLASPRIGLTMTEEGTFKIDARVGEGRWKNIIVKKVIVTPNASPQLSEQSPPDALDSSSQP